MHEPWHGKARDEARGTRQPKQRHDEEDVGIRDTRDTRETRDTRVTRGTTTNHCRQSNDSTTTVERDSRQRLLLPTTPELSLLFLAKCKSRQITMSRRCDDCNRTTSPGPIMKMCCIHTCNVPHATCNMQHNGSQYNSIRPQDNWFCHWINLQFTIYFNLFTIVVNSFEMLRTIHNKYKCIYISTCVSYKR